VTTEDIGWVATPEKLDELAAALTTASVAAIDTEFVREKTYYPQLCLIQVGTSEQVACLDCLAPLELTPVYAELFRPNFTWVLHSARQDLEVIWQRAERMPPRLIDTQVAAALCGYPAQVGLEELLRRTLGVELGESYARTDWSRRPLPAPAFHYALEDVRYLLPAWQRLEAQLAGLGRDAWLREDCERMLAERPEADTTVVWARLKGVHALQPEAKCAALALVRWRETAAQRADRPRRWLLADDVLFAIAAALPSTTDELMKLASPKFVARNGEAVLAAVAARTDPDLQAEVANAAGAPPDRNVVRALQEQVRQRAAALGIEPEILAPRRDLVALAAGNPPAHLTQGWRATELGGIL
jgi:ribonuclease D